MRLLSIIKIIKSVNYDNYGLFIRKFYRRFTAPLKPLILKMVKPSISTDDIYVVFSEARGGSTWVMEQLQQNLNAITVFEPLWGRNGCFKRIANQFSSPFFLGREQSDKLLKEFLNDTLHLEQTSWRTLQFNSVKSLMNSNKLVVKLVNTNLIAPWFVQNIPLKNKPIYVVRHPLAIIFSRETYSPSNKKLLNQRVGPFDWDRIKSNLHPYYLYKKELDGADTKFNRYLIEWCIRNKDFINGKYDDFFDVIFYEEIVLEPKVVWQALFPGSHFRQEASQKESGTTSLNHGVSRGYNQISKWVGKFKEDDIKVFQETFEYFGIQRYNAFSPIPDHLKL